MTRDYAITLTGDQVKYLMSKFNIEDPNEACEYIIELLFLEGVEATQENVKLYMMKMMQEELRQC